MKRIIRAATNGEISQRENEHMELAREMAAEGIVLLENDGVLPMQTGNIALYGVGARRTCFGGTGSGETSPRCTVSYEQGLLEAGFAITTTDWLNRYDVIYQAEEERWLQTLAQQRKDFDKMGDVELKGKNQFLPPIGERIVPTEAETAIYVLTRRAGEGGDRQTKEGDYYIRKEELEQLQEIRNCYANVILLLNVGGVIDLSFLDEMSLNAVLLVSQGGMMAGRGLADVITGKISPSGKLSDTWAYQYSDYPCSDTYAYRDRNPDYEEYKEDIFVGYRWFDAMNKKSRYAFGFGKSYTQFDIQLQAFFQQKEKLVLRINVTNTGMQYAGKEVVQVYAYLPKGSLKKEERRLVAFKKTQKLQPQCVAELTLEIDIRDLASYNEESASWILEEGKYILGAGKSSDEIEEYVSVEVTKKLFLEECRNRLVLKQDIEVYQPLFLQNDISKKNVSMGCILRTDCISTRKYAAVSANSRMDDRAEAVCKKLSLKQQIQLLVGETYVGKTRNTVFGCSGKTTASLVKRGIPDLTLCDGPQGLDVIPKAIYPRQNFCSVSRLPKKLNKGIIKWLMQKVPDENYKGTVYYQYTTMWPCETMMAQTWNVELAEKMGDAVGREMEELGIVFWLGPALNIHRNPLCGRNYEYYSEDPYLTGKLASAVTKGVQSHKGCFVTLKHFAANNQETNRNRTDAIVSERALREIYLKAFQMAVQEADAKGVMSAYNKINGTYCANNKDLLIYILREEWGFDGIVMTDWWASGHDECLDELACAAGNDLIMPGFPGITKKIYQAYKEGKISREDITCSARNIIKIALDSNVVYTEGDK